MLAGLVGWSTVLLVALGFYPHPTVVECLNHYLGAKATNSLLGLAKGLSSIIREVATVTGPVLHSLYKNLLDSSDDHHAKKKRHSSTDGDGATASKRHKNKNKKKNASRSTDATDNKSTTSTSTTEQTAPSKAATTKAAPAPAVASVPLHDEPSSSEEEEVKATTKVPAPHPLLSVLQVGLRVEVRYMGKGEWMKAVVKELGDRGQGLKVQYDDGEEESNVSLDAVRIPGGGFTLGEGSPVRRKPRGSKATRPLVFEPQRAHDSSDDSGDGDDDSEHEEGTYRNVAVLSSSRGDECEMGSTDDGWEMVSHTSSSSHRSRGASAASSSSSSSRVGGPTISSMSSAKTAREAVANNLKNRKKREKKKLKEQIARELWKDGKVIS